MTNNIMLDKYMNKKTSYIIIFSLLNTSVSNSGYALSENDEVIRKHYFITED